MLNVDNLRRLDALVAKATEISHTVQTSGSKIEQVLLDTDRQVGRVGKAQVAYSPTTNLGQALALQCSEQVSPDYVDPYQLRMRVGGQLTDLFISYRDMGTANEQQQRTRATMLGICLAVLVKRKIPVDFGEYIVSEGRPEVEGCAF